MLGNIKFIGELGKLQIVHDSILHRCCEQLVGRRRQPVSDQAEDLECLCHLMRTCGRVLDTPKARNMMDQYFERLHSIAHNEQFPLRIRFLVQDVIEMRRNKWMPRKIGKAPEGPRTIQQVREDAYRDGCIYMPQASSPPGKNILGGGGVGGLINPLEGNFFDNKPRGGSGKKGLAEDLFGGYNSYLGTGPGVIQTEGLYEDIRDTGQTGLMSDRERNNSYSPTNKQFNQQERSPPRYNNEDISSSTEYNNQYYQDNRQQQQFRNNYHQQQRLPDFGDRYSANRTKDRERRQQQMQQQQQGQYRNADDRRFNNGDNNRPFNSGAGDNGRGFNNMEKGFNGDSRFGNKFNDNNRYNDRFNKGRGGGGGPPMGGGGGSRGDEVNGMSVQGGNMNNLPPRFKKLAMNQVGAGVNSGPGGGGGGGGGSNGPSGNGGGLAGKEMEVSLRPQTANNMLFKPKSAMFPKSGIRGAGDGSLNENSLLGPPPISAQPVMMMMQQETPIVIKQGSLDKGKRDKNKGGKGPTREEVFNKMDSILKELLDHRSSDEALESWKENGWLPSKMNQTAVTHFFKLFLFKEKSGEECMLAREFIGRLLKDGAINTTHCQEAMSKILSQMDDSDDTFSKSHVAATSAWLVSNGHHSLKEVCEPLQGGQQHPVFLLTLQHLEKDLGQDKLKVAFEGLKMAEHVPEEHRSDETLVLLLEEYGLSFLMPLLGVQQEMARKLADAPDPTAFARWLNDDEKLARFHSQPGFVMALFGVVLGHVTASTTLADGPGVSQQPDKTATEGERELLAKFRPVLQSFVRDYADLQLAAVYALQVFCFEKDFPKGMLLRAFVNCYELDILDEQAFLRWKEDVNDSYSGKGKALFQVRTTFTLLVYNVHIT